MKPFALKNGIPTYVVDSPGTQAVTVLVLVKVGSRYEPEHLSGASHFIEHMLFKGTERRRKPEDIAMELDAVGAEYNAFTGKDITGYWVKVPKQHVNLAVDLLHDMLANSRFPTPEMNRERQVIMEEINMYHDNPMMHVDELLEEAMFAGSTLGRDIAGTHQTMTDMKRADVIAFKNQYYRPDRMVISVAGAVPRGVQSLLNKHFGTLGESSQFVSEFDRWSGWAERKKPRVGRQYKETQQVQVMLGFPGVGYGHKDETAAQLLSVLLGGSMSSRLFLNVRERKGLCYFIRARHGRYEDTGLFTVQSGLDRSRLPLAGKTIMRELRKVKKTRVGAAELRRAKDYLIGTMTLGLEDSSKQASWYAKQHLYGNAAVSPKTIFERIQKVSPAVLQRVANTILDERRMGVAGIGPFKTDASLTKPFV